MGTNIGFGIGCGMVALGATIAVLHLAAWAKWKLQQRQNRRHWTVPDNDGWIRPPRAGGNRQIKL